MIDSSALYSTPLPLDLEQIVDQLCDEFEDALKRGIVPDTDECLARLHHSAHRHFLHEITKLLRAYAVPKLAAGIGQMIHSSPTASADPAAVEGDNSHDIGDTTRAFMRRSLEFLQQIDEAGAAFESALSRGELLRIEDLVAAVDAEARPRLLRELLKLEMEFRAKKGESPSLRDYRARFPVDARLVKLVYLENFVPSNIGEFSVQRLLGRGGFGHVYQGWDAKLSRSVALKVFRRDPGDTATRSSGLLFEARTAAQLRHPGIVAVYAVLPDEDGDEFLVLEYVDGSSLESELRSRHLSPHEAAELVLAVVQALQHSHSHGLIHCDLKPANILLDQSRRPRVTDFGVARHMKNLWRSLDVAGTLPYMAPEQAAGETHRLDARTDLWAIGVILYRAVTGWLPFAGASQQELVEAIRHQAPKDPLAHVATIPIELARIIGKCLTKQMIERYQSAADLADDLRTFLTPLQQRSSDELTVGESPMAAVVPKGLRSFNESDREFFLQLVPGPRDRRGVPESVRFWENRLRETDASRTFRVGLLYGPSGCGKSSLMRAGILPRLHSGVHLVTIEATRDDTEARLARELCRCFPGVIAETPLAETLSNLREGRFLAPDEKLLIVFDQFEQWLHGRRQDEGTVLVEALRQCDGGRIQAVAILRDDFWTPATRFFKRLDVTLVDGQNASAVDLFDEGHAAAVLAAFGAAHGRLPADPSKRTVDAQRFVECAVEELSDNGWIVPIRLCIFAEMVKTRPWTSATLRDLGGAEGLGTVFLEEVFEGKSASPSHRLLRNAARSTLEQLLPPAGSDIRGHSVSEIELRAVAGYEHEPKQFAALLRCLDQELRLITPADPSSPVSRTSVGVHTSASQPRYQLTHDFLVMAIRGWLNQTRRHSFEGRAQLRLKEYAAAYSSRPGARQLPSWWEWVSVLLLTHRHRWKSPEQTMMRSATRFHAWRSGILLAAVLGLSVITYDRFSATRADGLVHALASSESRDVPGIIERLRDYRWWAASRITQRLAANQRTSDERTRLLLGGLVVGVSRNDELCERLLDGDPPLTLVIADLMQSVGALKSRESQLRMVAINVDAPPSRRLRACVALARLDSVRSAEAWLPLAHDAATLLREDLTRNPRSFDAWVDGLAPARQWLVAPLRDAFSDNRLTREEQVLVAEILASYASDDTTQLVELALSSIPRQFTVVSRALAEHADVVREELRREATSAVSLDGSDEDKDRLARRRANAILLLKELGTDDYLWPSLQHQPEPRLRTFLLQHFREVGTTANWIERLASEADPGVRQGIILILGSSALNRSLPARLPEFRSQLLRVFRDDPDAGVHSAAEWALRQLGQEVQIDVANSELAQLGVRSGYRWYVTQSGITMVIVDPPGEVVLGSPENEAGRDATDEKQWTCNIHWPFAISATEITQAQYVDVIANYPERQNDSAPEARCPVNVVSAIDAEEFCRQLCVREGLASDEQEASPETAKGPWGRILANRCYRLPIEAEWEVACRAGTVTPHYFGFSPEFLPCYACYIGNSGSRTWTVGQGWPNAWGLFDMLGNVAEWCQDIYKADPGANVESRSSASALRTLTYLSVRGSDFNALPRMVRAANRRSIQAREKAYTRGFRIAQTLPHQESTD